MIPITLILAALKPWDIALPPERLRVTQGPVAIVYAADPRERCWQNAGFVTIGCTLGAPGSRRVTILPEPSAFADEPFARSLMAMPAEQRADAIRGACRFTRQVYARLACHEIAGHQLGGWSAKHER